MEMTMTLRSEIERGIAGMGMNFSEFGEWSGINRGIFSAILNSNPPKPISLNQLERIGKALGHEEGWMFELYIDECFYDGRPNRRRVEPFLIRSAELDRIDCIAKVLSRLLEDLKQLEMIFEIGEALYTSGKIKESAVFYQCIVQNEKYHQSERLAVSHYRLFRAALGEDNEQNLRAAIEFEPFCEKLPDHHRLDGLMRLFDVYFMLEKLDKAEYYSRELVSFSTKIYNLYKQGKCEKKVLFGIASENPLIVYYGYGFLSMETILFRKGDFAGALEYNKLYEDLSWFEGLDESGFKYVEKISDFSKQNKIHIELLSGKNTELYLKKCVEFLKSNPSETLVSFLFISQAANLYDLDIDHILEKFEKQMEQQLNETSHYKKIHQLNRYKDICYELTLYFFNKVFYQNAHSYLLKALNVAIKINDKDTFMKCISLFERNRKFASLVQKKSYIEMLRKVEV
ncbi:hypothetical protein [Saccharibacillus sacchari]|uniref:hypothetical protein n=1 Tax=Saccharibacillus sacchari TaxID=456493 RepID=UPI0004B48356|nr:hypothetical protein [Saccharibacillus sacchari]